MKRASYVMCLLVFGVLSALAACHDARRNNPIDTGAISAVVVTVEQANREAATISWTQYDAPAPFAAYWVLRSTARGLPEINTTTTTTEQFITVAAVEPQVDTVAVIDDSQITAYEDDSLVANLSYVYRVSIVNTHGLEATSQASAPVRGPSMQQLSFYSDRTGNWEVFVMNEDGSGVQNLH